MNQKIDLNGSWQLRWNDGQRGDHIERLLGPDADMSRAIEAHVPGEVHLDLVRAGLIAEPTVDLNCLAARWVEQTYWGYRRTFDAPALEPGERAFLTLERLDLAAIIYLNGQEVGRHANEFYPCVLDVTGGLMAGQNVLVVVVESGVFYAADKPGRGFGMHADSELSKRNWLRKVQSSFGWDWSTHLLNVGITGPVRLEICARARFDRFVALARLSDDLKQGAVTARIFAEGLGDAAQPGKLTARLLGPAGQPGPQVTADVTIQPGLHPVEVTIPVAQPELWWPVNHGAQPLYTVQAALAVAGQVIGEAQRQVGFRHVRVNQDPHPQGGSYFVIEINGKPIFVKGANFVPADMIPARLDRARYATLVDRALEANFNLLRIWGGGLYESDDFYEICDARGVLVWQEFIFACAKYPAYDEAFLADVKQEAAYQVRRLAHHPSLVVWCGNNEMEEGNYHWGYEKGVAHPDYALFHMVLPVILKQEDGTRYYQPSSPYSPDHESPRRPDMGDQHPWTVGFGNTDYRDYRGMISRFPNEGGILGPTALPTVLACLPPGEEDSQALVFDRKNPARCLAWDVHDNAFTFGGMFSYPNLMLEQWLGKTVDGMTIEDLVYYGGIVHGEGLTEYIRNFRRRMFSSASAVFWMYNDVWPATRSWTIVDYYLRRTPAFYPVKRACKPLSVALVLEDGVVRVYGVNEGPEWQGELHCGLFALAGGYPVEIFKSITLPANASTLVAKFSAAMWDDLGATTHGAFAILSRDGQEAARDRLFQPYYKELAWPKAEVRVRRENGEAVFESDVFAWRVCLDLEGEVALPDNFFDVLPGIPTVLDWPDSLGIPRVMRIGNLCGS